MSRMFIFSLHWGILWRGEEFQRSGAGRDML
jgi:hypothetical protein